jgi:hypothetical protein
MRQGLPRQNSVRPFAQHVVLGEGSVRRVFGYRGRRHAERVQDHDEAGHAAIGLSLLGQEIAGEREIRLMRIAFAKVDLAVVGAESGQIVGQRQGVGSCACGAQP